MAQRFEPGRPLHGELRVPADKSISHRAALLAAMAEGETRVENYLDSADTRSTLAAIQALGAGLGPAPQPPHSPQPQRLVIRGVGLRGARSASIDAGNAGTLIRLLPGWLAGQPEGRCWRLDGDDSIRKRPMARVVDPLQSMGARIATAPGGVAPLDLASAPLRGIEYDSAVASAQVKSCLLLAGLLAEGPTTVSEPGPSRDHTERMLAAAGARVERDGTTVTVHPAKRIEPGDLVIPGDISSAAFFLVAATLVEGSEILLRGVGVNPTRTGALDILTRMGAAIEIENRSEVGGEPVADLRVSSAPLRGTEIGGDEIPRAIDELPILALAAAFAEGPTVIRDASELRRKESDRIETTAAALRAIGAGVETRDDGLTIDPSGRPEYPAGPPAYALGPPGNTSDPGSAVTGGAVSGGAAEIDSGGDHRIAMLGAIAGLITPGGVTVHDFGAAAVSYPDFAADLTRLA